MLLKEKKKKPPRAGKTERNNPRFRRHWKNMEFDSIDCMYVYGCSMYYGGKFQHCGKKESEQSSSFSPMQKAKQAPAICNALTSGQKKNKKTQGQRTQPRLQSNTPMRGLERDTQSDTGGGSLRQAPS